MKKFSKQLVKNLIYEAISRVEKDVQKGEIRVFNDNGEVVDTVQVDPEEIEERVKKIKQKHGLSEFRLSRNSVKGIIREEVKAYYGAK
tara:strand:+ start:726 stop:989 length:264 start_codon:yes stop_codon:yes gene_type:complete